MSCLMCGRTTVPPCPVCHPKPAPSPQPEMPEGWVHAQTQGGSFVHARCTLPMWLIEQLLAAQGLRVITAKQNAVLDACITGVREYYDESGGYTNGNSLADDLRNVLRAAGLL